MGTSNIGNSSQFELHGHIESCFERKSCMMKWIYKVFKSPRMGLRRTRLSQLTKEGSTFWWCPKKTLDDEAKDVKGDSDSASAFPLADRIKKRKGYAGREKDEDFLKPLPESFGMPHVHPHSLFVPSQILPRGYRVCGGCKGEISHGSYLSSMGIFWHPKCFCCHACGQLICEAEFSLSGTDTYHKSCYKELHHPKCDVCRQFIPINRLGLIEYRVHPFWGQKYCPSHEHDETPRCCSCELMEPKNMRYISLEDMRSLCLECLDSAIMDANECQPLYHSIRDFYEGINMKIDQQIPMLLVERQALNEVMEGEKDIFNKPKVVSSQILYLGTHLQKLNRICEITAILVLYGLPRLLTGSILAHELMHGWLRLNGYRNLRPEIEEGICQVLSYMWLESEVIPGSTVPPSSSSDSVVSLPSKKAGISDIEKRNGEFFMHQIANDTSPAYGEGFRAAHAAVSKYGLRSTLNHISLTGTLPL